MLTLLFNHHTNPGGIVPSAHTPGDATFRRFGPGDVTIVPKRRASALNLFLLLLTNHLIHRLHRLTQMKTFNLRKSAKSAD